MTGTTTARGLCLLGSTGSIGTQTLKIVEKWPEQFQVRSLAAGRNLALVREQIRKFKPALVSVIDEGEARTLRQEFPEVRFLSGEQGLLDCVSFDGIDVVVVGVVGFAALSPTLHAIKLDKIIALANKESLVVGGSLLKREAAKSKSQVIPVDSEHNALYQLLEGKPLDQVQTLVLTASGGPLLRLPDLPLEDVTPDLAIRHPNWKMGPKISVDSATLMNKGLEMIEAHFLFDFPANRIEIWIHPQSIVHGAIWMTDNTCLAQLSKPDMCSSLGYALAYPKRLPQVVPKLTFQDMARLEFLAPDEKRFPALRLARQALEAGPSFLVALNAANEVAVQAFLEGGLLFSGISQVIEGTLDTYQAIRLDQVEAIYEADTKARELAKTLLRRRQ